MIASGAVQKQYVGQRRETPYDVLQQGTETESQQTGDVGGRCLADDRPAPDDAATVHDDRSSPRRITGRAGT
jgi:hypothetical protein